MRYSWWRSSTWRKERERMCACVIYNVYVCARVYKRQGMLSIIYVMYTIYYIYYILYIWIYTYIHTHILSFLFCLFFSLSLSFRWNMYVRVYVYYACCAYVVCNTSFLSPFYCIYWYISVYYYCMPSLYQCSNVPLCLSYISYLSFSFINTACMWHGEYVLARTDMCLSTGRW